MSDTYFTSTFNNAPIPGLSLSNSISPVQSLSDINVASPTAAIDPSTFSSASMANVDPDLGSSSGFGFTPSMSGISSIANGIGDLFSAAGDSDEAGDYEAAEGIAQTNAKIAAESGTLQQQAAGRQITQTIGQQGAQVAAAGFERTGSAQDLLRSSQMQGATTKAVINAQTAINVNGYNEQADAYKGQAAAAQAAAEASTAGGIGGILGGVVSMTTNL